jgi:hypothetical protein
VTNRYRSVFWPGLLILAGVIALLVNTGAISADRLAQLVYLWPLILIVIGLELIVRRSLHGTAADLAAALIVLLAVVGAVGYVAVSPNPSATHARDWSGAVGTIERAAVELDVASATVTLSGDGALGSDLYQAHIEYSGPAPNVDFDSANGKLKIAQQNTNLFQNPKLNITLKINPAVPWAITQSSGASNDTLNVAGVNVTSISLSTGASREEITLGPPSGVIPVTIDGGALTVRLHTARETQVSIAVSGGAVNLNAPGRQSHAIGEVSYQTPGFAGAPDAYRVEVNGGACNVSLDNSVASG